METVPVPGSICSPSLGRGQHIWSPHFPQVPRAYSIKATDKPQGGVDVVEAALAAEDLVLGPQLAALTAHQARPPSSIAAAAQERESHGWPSCCAAVHTLPGLEPTLQARPL